MILVNKYYEMLVYANSSLRKNAEYLNSLNVFPVPDGDTGSNMSATFNEAVNNILLSKDSTISSVSASLARGALLGARGNSGVILSQILKGLSKGLEESVSLDVKSLEKAFVFAKKSAYKAVMTPKEGTILSVIRAIAESAEQNSEIDNVTDFLENVIDSAKSMLEETRNILPQNKQAGTVDAGGAGLVIILQSFLDVLNNNTTEELSFDFNKDVDKFDFVDVHPDFNDIVFQYCTEFIIKAHVDEIMFKEFLSSIGDSVVVVSIDSITKVHVHTNTPGVALNKAIEFGDIINIKIDNMKEQAKNINNLGNISDKSEKSYQEIITVSNGSGITEMFNKLGVKNIISGGQSTNPSVDDFVKLITSINAENIIILPNNKNIILAAEQAKKLVECNVKIIKSKTIPQGITACAAFNPESSFEDNICAMEESLENIISCEITNAIKDSKVNNLDISTGDILSIKEGSIIANNKTYLDAIDVLFDIANKEKFSLATVIYNDEIEEDFLDKLKKYLESFYTDIDTFFINGHQSIYQFIIGFEQ